MTRPPGPGVKFERCYGDVVWCVVVAVMDMLFESSVVSLVTVCDDVDFWACGVVAWCTDDVMSSCMSCGLEWDVVAWEVSDE